MGVGAREGKWRDVIEVGRCVVWGGVGIISGKECGKSFVERGLVRRCVNMRKEEVRRCLANKFERGVEGVVDGGVLRALGLYITGICCP